MQSVAVQLNCVELPSVSDIRCIDLTTPKPTGICLKQNIFRNMGLLHCRKRRINKAKTHDEHSVWWRSFPNSCAFKSCEVACPGRPSCVVPVSRAFAPTPASKNAGVQKCQHPQRHFGPSLLLTCESSQSKPMLIQEGGSKSTTKGFGNHWKSCPIFFLILFLCIFSLDKAILFILFNGCRLDFCQRTGERAFLMVSKSHAFGCTVPSVQSPTSCSGVEPLTVTALTDRTGPCARPTNAAMRNKRGDVHQVLFGKLKAS